MEKYIFIDQVQTLGVHNNVARIELTRLGANGKASDKVELLVPLVQVQSLIESLQKIKV